MSDDELDAVIDAVDRLAVVVEQIAWLAAKDASDIADDIASIQTALELARAHPSTQG